MKDKIDIVVLWVNDKDPVWLKQKAELSGVAASVSSDCSERYRSWDNFHFWFRGIEKFMPWVNHIFLVTCGHHPSWLNIHHPKLSLVRHDEIMPQDALPTYNSRAIEACIMNIPDLSEKFIYFNDDMFITAPCKPSDFFRNGLPTDNPVIGANIPVCGEKGFGETLSIAYILGVINGHFRRKQVIKQNLWGWLGPHIGIRGYIAAFTKFHHRFFDGFKNHHCCQPYLKSTFEEAWAAEGDKLSKTVHSRFREDNNLSQWFFRYWALCRNTFYPATLNNRYFVNVNNANADDTARKIMSDKYISMCINDADTEKIYDFDDVCKKINEAFTYILPEKSSFEI